MKLRTILATTLIASALTAGCASNGSTQNAAQQAEFEAAVAAAEASRTKAASVGGEWRDTGKMIKSAQEAAAAGDYAKAMKLVDEARLQGEIGYEQAMAQQAAGPHF